MKNKLNNINIVKISILLFVLLVFIVSVLYIYINKDKNTITIKNETEISSHLSTKSINDIKNSIINYLLYSYEDIYKTPFQEEVTVREKTYSESESEEIIKTSFIVDIPLQKITFQVNYSYSNNSTIGINNPIVIGCPDSFNLIYGNDSCLGSNKDSDQKVDPILSSLPYSNDYYSIIPVKNDDNSISLTIKPSGISKTLLEEDYKRMVTEWLSRQGVNPNNYELTVSY